MKMSILYQPWSIQRYHSSSDPRTGCMVSRQRIDGSFGAQIMRRDGTVTIGGDGPLYCFIDTNSALRAIRNFEDKLFKYVD